MRNVPRSDYTYEGRRIAEMSRDELLALCCELIENQWEREDRDERDAQAFEPFYWGE